MLDRWIKIFFVVFVLTGLSPIQTYAQSFTNDKHVEVGMRMIGHELLLDYGDSTSRVLPILADGNKYGVQFESELGIDPMSLGLIVGRVMEDQEIATHYFVEVEECTTGDVVYSYEVGQEVDTNFVPCGTRPQPLGCYGIFITVIESVHPIVASHKSAAILGNGDKPTSKGGFNFYVLLLVGLFLLGLAVYWKKRQNAPNKAHLIAIGAFDFDKLNMELSIDDQRVELTSKESDLLDLLYGSANEPIARETILEKVWGDQGDYVGRTLDVFISKLRKKLESDAHIKIINIRGVGYKLVINSSE